jgi:hypothetical protein
VRVWRRRATYPQFLHHPEGQNRSTTYFKGGDPHPMNEPGRVVTECWSDGSWASRLILHPSDMAQSRHFYGRSWVCGSSMSMATAAQSSACSTFWAAASSNCPARQIRVVHNPAEISSDRQLWRERRVAQIIGGTYRSQRLRHLGAGPIAAIWSALLPSTHPNCQKPTTMMTIAPINFPHKPKHPQCGDPKVELPAF